MKYFKKQFLENVTFELKQVWHGESPQFILSDKRSLNSTPQSLWNSLLLQILWDSFSLYLNRKAVRERAGGQHNKRQHGFQQQVVGQSVFKVRAVYYEKAMLGMSSELQGLLVKTLALISCCGVIYEQFIGTNVRINYAYKHFMEKSVINLLYFHTWIHLNLAKKSAAWLP